MKSFALDILHALEYMHNEDVIHTDLKLENILIKSSDDEEKYPVATVCDFGLCHVIDRNIGMGKKAYMKVKCGT